VGASGSSEGRQPLVRDLLVHLFPVCDILEQISGIDVRDRCGSVCFVDLQRQNREDKELKRPALRAVLHALAMDTPSPDRTLDAEAV
jgi:hypothetical protein